MPREVSECDAEATRQIASAATAVLEAAARRAWQYNASSPDDVVAAVERLINIKQRVDDRLESVIALRVRFADLPAGPERRETIRHYLQITTQLIDLSGRLRYLLRDAINNASYDLSPYPDHIAATIELLTAKHVEIGAEVMSYVLFDPQPESGLEPFGNAERLAVLKLMAACRHTASLSDLARFMRQKNVSAELLISAAETVRQIGLSQDPRPGYRWERFHVEPAITAEQLHTILSEIPNGDLNEGQTRRRSDLLDWLTHRIKQGVVEDRFRFGRLEVRPGDWVLMRNPSPYNNFTDLAPGLFTHVGVVAVETDEQGIRRFVITDLPERGDQVPATNVDAYLERTLHYFFLRHEDPEVGKKMGQAAAQLIGNPTQFDLTFRTDRVLAMKGKPLRGQLLNTYCAGFLLICAQETGRPRREFFPIPESPPGGRFLDNLAKLDISIGDDFVSPTGAVFSPHLKLVGRREPMYSPAREIREAIYDHFAELAIHEELVPSPNTFQMLREKAAGLAAYNPWLAKALAKAGNVSEHIDLQAAAKAAAVVETLDEITERARDEFFDAREALLLGPIDESTNAALEEGDAERFQLLQQRHTDIYRQWLEGNISPRDLRLRLVEYYKARGKQELRERFFQPE